MALLLLLPLLLLSPPQLYAQQTYVEEKQLDCSKKWNVTLGFLCNAAPSCTSYLTFRSTPTYNNPVTIGYLLSADASQIAAANNISDVDLLPADTLVIVPVNCSCFGNYYQHNASYTLKRPGETYFTVANNTYQALTACQAMEAQNPYNFGQLVLEMKLAVPLRCACPTPKQTAAGYKYLLTYLVRQGEFYDSIAGNFAGAGADVQGIYDANTLTEKDLIFFFTPLLVPLKTEPTKENINTVASPPPPLPPPTIPAGDTGGSSKWVFIGVGIGAGILFILSSLSLVWFFCYRHPRHRKSPVPPPKLADEESGNTAEKPLSSWSEGIRSAIETLTVYKFEDVEKGTNSFAESNRIKGSSSVYRASFKGDDAVVKILKGDVSREIDVLRQINHSRIIRLSGYCQHQGITYLVYEYAEKSSLAEWLHNAVDSKYISVKGEGGLDWKQRAHIAYDVADALNYLHNFTNPPCIHKNLTSSNVLLDGNMRAKIANFGLARTMVTNDDQGVLTRHVVGTYGYMAPEYVESGLVTPKLDVFSLGVVMLELLSGKEAILTKSSHGSNEGKDEAALLYESIEGVLGGENVRDKVKEFMDPLLGEEYPLELAYAMGELARRCVARNPDGRPSLSEVFMALSKLLLSSLDWDPSHDENETSHSFCE